MWSQATSKEMLKLKGQFLVVFSQNIIKNKASNSWKMIPYTDNLLSCQVFAGNIKVHLKWRHWSTNWNDFSFQIKRHNRPPDISLSMHQVSPDYCGFIGRIVSFFDCGKQLWNTFTKGVHVSFKDLRFVANLWFQHPCVVIVVGQLMLAVGQDLN